MIHSVFFLKRKNVFLLLQRPLHAYVYTRCSRHNLLTGEVTPYDIKDYLRDQWRGPVSAAQNYRVVHFSYEAGAFLQNDPKEFLPPAFCHDDPLVIDIEYRSAQVRTDFPLKSAENKPFLWKSLEGNQEDYKRRFEQIRSDIKEGEYYQLNLTQRFHANTDEGSWQQIFDSLFVRHRKRLGAMAHATYLGEAGAGKNLQGLISNSPELHFQMSPHYIQCAPIKGTMPLPVGATASLRHSVKQALNHSLKEQAELYMIADLLRHELNSLTAQGPVEVVQKKHFFSVPGLLHQCTLLQKHLNPKDPPLWSDLLSTLFPCGSITGAPKKAVMKRIAQLEQTPRGFYCGGTLLHTPKRVAMSVNIRTATLQRDTVLYGAGGGITYQSQWEDEWKEMWSKLDSFAQLVAP